MAKAPLEPVLWPEAGHVVNRDRIFDFYAKEADFFRGEADVLELILPEYPGLDSGLYGHWGNQNEDVWKDGRWNRTDHGSLVSGVWRGAGMTIPKAVSVRLGDGEGEAGMSAVFNPVTATWDAVWRGGFVTFSDIRHGFMDGPSMAGQVVSASRAGKPPVPVDYRGFYRHGRRVIFSYAVGGREWLDWMEADGGGVVRRLLERGDERAVAMTGGGPAQWPQVVETRGVVGAPRPGEAFVIDTITLPFENPWRALMHVTGHDFFTDGTGAICTMGGEVWTVRGVDGSLERLRWRRFATGLHQPLGLKVVDGAIHVLGRDQITRLHDLNGDGEADWYECVTNRFDTPPGGHDFITGLETGPDGAFYFVSATQGVCRAARDGSIEPLATGFRNANGLAVSSDGTVVTNAQEGEWTNASVLFRFPAAAAGAPRPYFGYGGPKPGVTVEKPFLQLPRGYDNSTGGACFVDGPAGALWAPLRGALVSASFGAGAARVVVADAASGGRQGAAVAIPGSFRSGVHRARFSPHDGNLYVSGTAGWGTYTPDDGCLQRVRLVAPPLLPAGWEARENGVLLRFTGPLDPAVAGVAANQFAQTWNYRYAADYGSPEYSVRHPGTPGHDALEVRRSHLLPDGRSLFLEIPQITPANQLHLRLRVGGPRPIDVFATVHTLAAPFTDYPGYEPIAKIPVPDPPQGLDAVDALARRANPWAGGEAGRPIALEAALGLQFATKRLAAKPGERLSLTFKNPDLVPHNFVLAKPGTLAALGDQVNKLISRPGAAARHYVPDSTDVLVWTDMVNPGQEAVIHFNVPTAPGEYPYFCSFPGHWQVMNGVLAVAAE